MGRALLAMLIHSNAGPSRGASGDDAHVLFSQGQLDKLLAVRFRDAGDVRKLFESLKVDAYYYLCLVRGLIT